MKNADTFLLPGESLDWEMWSLNGQRKGKLKNTVAEPGEAKSVDGVVIGLPATRCRTLGLQLPAADRTVLKDMVYAQLEKRGLGANGNGEECIFDVHVIDEQPDRSVVSVDVLPPDFPDDLCFKEVGGYTSASRLLPLPKGKLTLWVERDRLILAANRGGRLVHCQAVGAESEITPAVAQAIALSTLSLESDGLIHDLDGIVLWGDFPESQVQLLKEAVPYLQIQTLERPEPAAPASILPAAGELLPTQVKRARTAAARRRKLGLFALCALVVYSAVAVLTFLYMQNLEEKSNKLKNDLARLQPVAEMVNESWDRWEALQPAVDRNRFIMVQMNNLTKLFPPGGLVLRKFEARPDRIEIDGSARDPNVAFQFLEDIKADEENFFGYEWSMDQPRVNADKSATFEIVGRYGDD